MKRVMMAVIMIAVMCSGCASGISSPSATKPPSATTSVRIINFAFDPQSVTIHKGETVIWTNEDSTTHDINIDGVVSPPLKAGEIFSKRFDTPGTFNYTCGIHPGMKGTVIVI